MNGKPASAHIGRSLEEMAPLVAHIVVPIIKKVLETGEPVFNSEVIRHTVDGNSETTEIFLCTYHPLRAVDGEMLGISSVVQDVTHERQRTEALVRDTYAKLENRVEERTRELKKSESQFQALLESAPDGVVVCDDTGEIVLVNAVTERLLGYRREELVGLAVEILIPEIARDPSVNNRAGCQTETVPPVMAPRQELSAKRKDGSEFPVEVSLNPTAIGDRTLVMALIRDVTEARALLESSLSLATMVDSSTDAIIIARLDGTIQRWNKGAERMYGYSAQEAIGMPLDRLAPPEFLSEQRPVLEAIAGGVPAQLPDTVRVRKNGERIPVSLSAFPVKDTHGNVVEWAGVSRDLTEQKQLEQQFQQAQKMEAIGQLAGGIAHDFNNILTTIEGYGSFLQEMVPRTSEAHAMISAMLRASKRATTLTAQLLAFSRKQRIEVKTLDINDLLSELDQVLPRTIGEAITLTTDKGSSWYVRADPVQLEQVLLNLVVNSRDAMQKGGMLHIATFDITIENEPPGGELRFFPGHFRPGSYVQIDVIDSGEGISQDTVNHIFEPFYTTKEPGKGTGLGLAAVYGIVIQAGGFIGVESKIGQGTRFSVFLPKFDSLLDAPIAATDTLRFDGKGTVLLVEDDPDVLTLTTRILKKAGYTVLEALTPERAFEVYLNASVDLILTDVVMPGMSGPNFVSEWTKQNGETKTLYMSGYARENLEQHSVAESDVVAKPFSPSELLGRVADRLSR